MMPLMMAAKMPKAIIMPIDAATKQPGLERILAVGAEVPACKVPSRLIDSRSTMMAGGIRPKP
jgi:hypothetical protein